MIIVFLDGRSIFLSFQDLTEFGIYSSKEVEELDKQKRLYQAITKRQVLHKHTRAHDHCARYCRS